MSVIWYFVIGYILSFTLSYGMFFPYDNEKWDYKTKRQSAAEAAILSFIFSFLGPLGIVMSFLLTDFCRHGFYFPEPIQFRIGNLLGSSEENEEVLKIKE